MRLFEHLSAIAQEKFETREKYEGFQNLMYDLREGNTILDMDGRTISRKEAESTLRNTIFSLLGIDEKSSKRDRKRAIRKNSFLLYEVIEEEIDFKVETGFAESEFFNTLVETRNISRGDSQEFYSTKDVILSVAKVAGDHHSISLQRLGYGESYTVATSTYAIAVGADIDLYLAGRLDWTSFIDACAKAFIVKIQNDIYAEMLAAGAKLPNQAQFNKTMALSDTNKATFDELLEDVEIANGNVPCVIVGAKTALKKLKGLADIDWITEDQKREMATMGRLGSYEGTALIELPQRFAPNDVTRKLVANDKLFIFPLVEDKFIKMVDVGETEILEVSNIADRLDDTMKYEVQRSFGIGTQIGRYFGTWTIA